MKRAAAALFASVLLWGCAGQAGSDSETVRLRGLRERVEILRDRWGVPHVYAGNQEDLFRANGYINARDRLFQIDLWRRAGTGRLAEVLGPKHVPRDRMARLFVYRGDWNREWESYSPDAREIVRAFADGINEYIASLDGRWPEEFSVAGYAPGNWTPEDVVARIAGLSISRNLVSEVVRAQEVARAGARRVAELQLFDSPALLAAAPGLNPAAIPLDAVRDFSLLLSGTPFAQGSNNWAVDGSRSATGKPLLAADPHRSLEIPALRRTIHLVAPGWNAIGAGEPALPGIALGHNDQIAFGFTITGTDQQDVYIERLNPERPDEYWHNGGWKRMTVVRETVPVKGSPAGETVELRFTVHGPVIHQDSRRAFALRWVGAEPGGAGYLGALAAARAKNWTEFRAAMARYKVPSETMVYADRAGNIGLIVAGLTPLRRAHSGLLPVPGTGEWDWAGFLTQDDMPAAFNPPSHFVASANHDIRPPGYRHVLTHEWGMPYRYQRAVELLSEPRKFTVQDFERMQYDVVSIPARRFQAVLRRWRPPAGRMTEVRERMLAWDARIAADSPEALIFEIWFARLSAALASAPVRTETEAILRAVESLRDFAALEKTLTSTLRDLGSALGQDIDRWHWGAGNRILFHHPLHSDRYSRGPFPRAGDAYTLNAAGGNGMVNGEGASYRQVIDLADWDRSTMTNAPGEGGSPSSPHYDDLLDDWRSGRYHPLPFSRKAVEAATVERIVLVPY